MIYEWKMDGEVRNFGHALYEILYDKKDIQHWRGDIDKMFFLGAAYIHEDFVIDALNAGYDPVFIDCAWRGALVPDDFLEMASYRSTYGSNTEMMFSMRGIQIDFEYHPVYDLPDMHPKSSPNAHVVAIRNIKDPGEYNKDSMFKLGVDGVFSPVVETVEDVFGLVDLISGSRFVLSGSLKAAMVADAYGVPFAPMSSDGFVECPEKWTDWLSSLGIENVSFCANVREGREWYNDVAKGKI